VLPTPPVRSRIAPQDKINFTNVEAEDLVQESWRQKPTHFWERRLGEKTIERQPCAGRFEWFDTRTVLAAFICIL